MFVLYSSAKVSLLSILRVRGGHHLHPLLSQLCSMFAEFILYTVVVFEVECCTGIHKRVHWAPAACYVIHCAMLLCATSLVKLCIEKSFYLQDLTAFETTVCVVVVNFETTLKNYYFNLLFT